jgi:hypothetical protein
VTPLKPESTRNHLRLQSRDLASMSDAELALLADTVAVKNL